MPAKRKDDKKQEEEVDLASLPEWSRLCISIQWHPFVAELETHFPTSPFTVITRQDLVTHAREKGFYVPDSSESQISAFQLAKSYKDKVFWLDVQGRKAKKELLSRIEAAQKLKAENEEKGLAPPEIETLDETCADAMYLVKDYPSTQEEADALIEQNETVHFCIYVRNSSSELKQKIEEIWSEYQTKLENQEEAEEPVIPPDYPDLWRHLQNSSWKSPKNSLLRQFTPFVLEYSEEVEEEQTTERGFIRRGSNIGESNIARSTSPEETTKRTEEALRLVRKLKEPEDKKKEEAKKKAKKEEIQEEEVQEVPLEHSEMFCAKLLEMVLVISENFRKYFEWEKNTKVNPLYPLETTQEETPQEDTEQRPASKLSATREELALNLEPKISSVDDTSRVWNFAEYYHWLTSPFEKYVSAEYILACMIKNFVSDSVSSEIEVTEYVDQQDSVQKNIAGAKLKNQLQSLQNKFLSNQTVPGINRTLMPPVPQKSEQLRAAEKCEIYPFSNLSIEETERALSITFFEEALREVCPWLNWDFSDREYSERLSTAILKQVVSKELLFQPEVCAKYNPRNDCLYLGVYHGYGFERTSQREWRGEWKVKPNLQQWYAYFKEEGMPNEFLDVDEGKVGPLLQREQLLLPNDGSVMKMIEYAVGPRIPDEREREKLYTSKFKPIVMKDSAIMGVRPSEYLHEFWAYFQDRSRVSVEMNNLGCSYTHTLPLGLSVKFLSSGEIYQQLTPSRMQERLQTLQKESLQETGRAITSQGTIIRYLKDRTQLLFSNGNVSENSEGQWITTNNKGLRRLKSKDQEKEIEPLPCCLLTDPETLTSVIKREDNVTIITYSDNSRVVEHLDGSKVYTNSDFSETLIESPGYAPVRIFNDQSYEVYLPDEGLVRGFQESNQWVFEMKGIDQKVLKVKSEGEVSILSGEEKRRLQESNKDPEQTIAAKGHGVYTAELTQGKIWTQDNEGNYFEMNSRGLYKKNLAPLQEGEPELPKQFATPRLFIISNDNEATELLSQFQVDSFTSTISTASECHYFEEANIKYHTYLTPVKTTILEKGHLPNSPLLFYSYPKVLEYLQTPQKFPEDSSVSYYLHRTFLQYPVFSEDKRETFQKDLENYYAWKNEQKIELGVLDSRDPETQARDFKLKTQILHFRKQCLNLKDLTSSQIKEKALSKFLEEKASAETNRTLTQSESETETKTIQKKKSEVHKQERTHLGKDSSSKTRKIKLSQNFVEPGFTNYFESEEGIQYLRDNPPPDPPMESKDNTLPEVNPNELSDSENEHFEAMRSSLRGMRSSVQAESTKEQEKSDNPYVALVPESQTKGKDKPREVYLKPVTTPSCFTEVEKLQILKEQAEKDAADEYVLLKSKNFDVYGNPRTEQPSVTSIKTSNPNVVPNEKHILVESATDRRVRTISQSNRFHSKAPSVESMRKEGTHNVLYKALLKKQNYKEMIETQNMMISAYTSDPLKRSLLLMPASIRFGVLKVGEHYQMSLVVKNEDSQLMRFTIRQSPNKNVKVVFKPSPVASGMTCKLNVELNASETQRVDTEFEIVTRTEIYKVPVLANIASEREFARVNEESMKLHGRPALKSSVRIKGAPQSSFQQTSEWGETTLSEANLPSLPKVRSDHTLDPERSLKEVRNSKLA